MKKKVELEHVPGGQVWIAVKGCLEAEYAVSGPHVIELMSIFSDSGESVQINKSGYRFRPPVDATPYSLYKSEEAAQNACDRINNHVEADAYNTFVVSHLMRMLKSNGLTEEDIRKGWPQTGGSDARG